MITAWEVDSLASKELALKVKDAHDEARVINSRLRQISVELRSSPGQGWTTLGGTPVMNLTVPLLLVFSLVWSVWLNFFFFYEFVERVFPLGDARVQWRIHGRICGLDDVGSGISRAEPRTEWHFLYFLP